MSSNETQLAAQTARPNPLIGFESGGGFEALRPAETSSHGTPLYRLKELAWRGSAICTWLSFVALLFGQYDVLNELSIAIRSQLLVSLERLGLAPSNPEYFVPILKVGWLLLITGFRVLEIVGFFLYVLCFPLIATAYVIFSRFVKSSKKQGQPTATTSMKRSHLPLFSITGLGLLAWFVLYGDSVSRRAIIPGVVLAGSLFALLFYRIFRRTRPIDEEEAALLSRLEFWGYTILQMAAKHEEPKSRADIGIYRWMCRKARSFYRRVALIVRGRRGRDRISIYILIEYVFSAGLLALTAIIFWALALKLSISPTPIQLSAALQVSASHFLPGFAAPRVPTNPSIWIGVGAGTTAWLLFVVLIAPAGSLLPSRQLIHAKRLSNTYKFFRRLVLLFGRYLRWLDEREKAVVSP